MVWTGSKILAIPLTEPERLFGKPDDIRSVFHILAMQWHPDRPTGDTEVFQHINDLHAKAVDIAEAGMWKTPGELKFSVGTKHYTLHYFKSFDFELGTGYLSETTVTYVIRQEFADLAENARKVINNFTFPDKETERVMRMYLPKIKGYYETTDSIVLMIEKPADLIRMRDLLDHLGGKVDSRHVAWMVSRMMMHCEYMEWANITHNDLSLDTLFVCPEHHTVCVLGGWWYSVPVNAKPLALLQRTINHAPSEVIRDKKTSVATDLELARLTARELLGNANGIHLMHDKNIPAPMVNWLRLVSAGNAMKDYTQWREHILGDSFGKRKFVKMLIEASDVYSPA